MTLTEGLLIVIVIVLTIFIFARVRGDNSIVYMKPWGIQKKESDAADEVKEQFTSGCKVASPEKTALKDNAEYFTAASSGSDVLQYQCDDNGSFAYANDAFGAPNVSYKDYVMQQAVDPQVLQNHKAFVSDRLTNNTQNVTGPAMAIRGEIEGTEQVPWIGLRRAQHIAPSASAGSLQVPDIDPNAFAKKPTFTWSSS